MSREDTIKKYSYFIGHKINKWTVLNIVYDREKPDAFCKCECGTEKFVNLRTLLVGSSKDCGCGRKQTLRESRTKNIVGQKFGKLTVVELLSESTKANRRQYKCKCDCGNEVIVTSTYLMTGQTHSCGCLNSYYNAYIQKLLDNMKIKYRAEYPICIDNSRYRFDFYLPEYNLIIEYDGEQHYKPMRYHDDEDKNILDFRKRQERDKIKNNYCKENNINLLRIPYYEKNNIDSIIIDCLQRLNEKGVA